jgi:hypothetical protein
MASSYVENENSESYEMDSGSDSEVENGGLIHLESQKPGNLNDELEDEDGVGFIALHSTAEILCYWIFFILQFVSSSGIEL